MYFTETVMGDAKVVPVTPGKTATLVCNYGNTDEYSVLWYRDGYVNFNSLTAGTNLLNKKSMCKQNSPKDYFCAFFCIRFIVCWDGLQ